MKKIITGLMLGTMLAAMAVPSFAAEAKTIEPRYSLTATADYNGSTATGTGRSSKAMTSLEADMDIRIGNTTYLPTVVARTTGKTYVTARKNVTGDVREVYVDIYGDQDGDTDHQSAVWYK